LIEAFAWDLHTFDLQNVAGNL